MCSSEEASDRTGRKAEFVERDHATGVTAPQDIDRVRRFPVRGAAGNQSGAEPRPTHSFGVPVIADTCSRRCATLAGSSALGQPNVVGRWALSCQKWPGFQSGRVATSRRRRRPHAAARG
jgi:hypothetical protein